MGILLWLLVVAAQAALAVWLTRVLGVAVGLMVVSAIVTATTLEAGSLLRRVQTGSVTWKNRLAGLLLPWTFLVGGGQLSSLLIKNAIAGLVFAALMVICDRAIVPSTSSPTGQAGNFQHPSWIEAALGWMTAACWIALIVGWVWILRSYSRGHAGIRGILSAPRGVLVAILIPPAAVAASAGLLAGGWRGAALTVAALPLLVVAFPVVLMAIVVAAHALTGKPMRWN